jgi:hypothetical protein
LSGAGRRFGADVFVVFSALCFGAVFIASLVSTLCDPENTCPR